MEFVNLNNIIFLIFPLILLLILLYSVRKKRKILEILRLKNSKDIGMIKLLLLTLGGVLIVIALLSPQKLLDDEEVEVKGLNIYVLIDTSRSMMTEDVYPNRLESAKRVLSSLIKGLKGDRIGFIPFSDSAYIQLPLTDDYGITQNYIDALDTNLISGGGTQLYQGLELAEKSFSDIESENKTIIILSDGGDFDEKSLNFAKEHKLNIYSIGIGTEEGAVIPEYKNGKKIGFIKDESGSAVISKLNSSFLKQIAQENSGKYYEVNNLSDNSRNFIEDTANLERKNQRNESIKTYAKYYQIPLGIGIILILLGYLLKEVIEDEK